MKPNLATYLKTYSKQDLRQFHAYLTDIFINTKEENNETVSIFSAQLDCLAELTARKDSKYLKALNKILA